MNRIGHLLLPIFLTAMAGQSATADRTWTITNFDVQIDIGGDGTLEITETIDAEFFDQKHGIFREIPIHNDVGVHRYSLRFRLLSVDDGKGDSRETKVTHESNMVRIRMGDPDVTVSGRNVYRIRYRVDRAILWEGEHAVLRWNATGNEWRVPIAKASVTIQLPRAIEPEELVIRAWTGGFGSRREDFRFTGIGDREINLETETLMPGEGITIDVAMPADTIGRPGWGKRFGWFLADNFVYGIFFLTLGACVACWYWFGRDRPGLETVMVHYEPPEGLTPAESGTLIDERVDLRDISATIIDLAVRGYLKIDEIKSTINDEEPDYNFVRLRDSDGLKPFEKTLFDKIFHIRDTTRLSDLKEKFYDVLPVVRHDLYSSLSRARYFDGNPNTVRMKFAVVGLIVLFAALVISLPIQLGLVGRVFWIPVVITGVLSAVVVLVTSWFMPRKTRRGKMAWEKIAGLEEYIRRAEVDDIQSQEQQGVFERLLPYAIIFGLADRWAKAFTDLYAQPPDWYRPASTHDFTTAYLVHSMSRSVRSMNAVFPSQPRSTGTAGGGGGWSSGGFSGGSVGGGFGGGGGGGW